MVTERLTVSIAGMRCTSCVSRIETVLRDREGVLWADVNFAAQQAVVTYNPYTVAPRQLSDLIEQLGYEAPRWTARPITGSRVPQHEAAESRPQVLSPVWPALA
jgi:Cu+-exporting ATPase